MSWQTIETAPKDGRRVLVWSPGWLDGPDAACLDVSGHWYSPIDGSEFFPEPTHWMPLPEPPKQESK